MNILFDFGKYDLFQYIKSLNNISDLFRVFQSESEDKNKQNKLPDQKTVKHERLLNF